jgi:hypothetical protein
MSRYLVSRKRKGQEKRTPLFAEVLKGGGFSPEKEFFGLRIITDPRITTLNFFVILIGYKFNGNCFTLKAIL